MPLRIAVVTPFAFPSVRGNAVTVERIAGGLRQAGADLRVWDLSITPEAVIEREVEAFDPRLIHAFHAYRVGPFALRLARRHEIPLVVTVTGTDAKPDLSDPHREAPLRRPCPRSRSGGVPFGRARQPALGPPRGRRAPRSDEIAPRPIRRRAELLHLRRWDAELGARGAGGWEARAGLGYRRESLPGRGRCHRLPLPGYDRARGQSRTARGRSGSSRAARPGRPRPRRAPVSAPPRGRKLPGCLRASGSRRVRLNRGEGVSAAVCFL